MLLLLPELTLYLRHFVRARMVNQRSGDDVLPVFNKVLLVKARPFHATTSTTNLSGRGWLLSIVTDALWDLPYLTSLVSTEDLGDLIGCRLSICNS